MAERIPQEVWQDAKDRATKLMAFLTFKDYGIFGVTKTFPDHLQFVLFHKDKTYKEVKNMLFPTKPLPLI